MNESKCEMKLPGFRFHPTEEELLNFYLKSMVFGNKFRDDVIGFLNIYDYDPRDLPRLAKIGEREWYFFVPRDRKHGSGGRPNRTTETGFWKATGSDRQILSLSDPRKMLGLKKTLVFYQGRAPRGKKTEWIMNEYRLPDKCSAPKDIVLCKVYMKATSLKVLEQRAAMEEGVVRTYGCSSSSSLLSPVRPPNTAALASFFGLQFEEDCVGDISMQLKKEEEEMAMTTGEINKGRPCSSLLLPNGLQNMAELQVPKMTVDWTQDSFLTQLSPWLDNFTPFVPLC